MTEGETPTSASTSFAADIEPRRDNWSPKAEPRKIGLDEIAPARREDSNPSALMPRHSAPGKEESAAASPQTQSGGTALAPSNNTTYLPAQAPEGGGQPAAGTTMAPAPLAGQPGGIPATSAAPALKPRSEDRDPFEEHRRVWPPPPEDQSRQDSAAATSVQSGSAVLDRPGETDLASTELMSATGLDAPDDVTNIDLQESGDTATMGAAGSMTGQAMGLANVEEQQRAPNAHGYHGGEGLFGDRHAEALPMDLESRLARSAFWLQEQKTLFEAEGLAVGGTPRYALAAHVDDQGQECVYLYTNIGPGLVAKALPLGVWPAWDLVLDPQNQDRSVLVRMLGHPDPVHAAREHYLWLRGQWAAEGSRYHLAGIATTYKLDEPETLRRLVQPLNDHDSHSEAPFLVEARGPLVEPEGGTMHPLQHIAPELHVRLQAVLATPWAGEARLQALGWVASVIEGSMARDRPPFADVVGAIRERPPITPAMFDAVWADGAQVHAQTTVNLVHAMNKPEAQRGQADFFGYLLYHRALVGLVGLNHWRLSAHGHDDAFLADLAYLAAKANQDNPAFAADMTARLPDPGRSYWKPR